MQQLERPLEVALLLRRPREGRQGLRLALRKRAGATVTFEALLGKLANATRIPPPYRSAREPVQEGRHGPVVTEPTGDRKSLLPARVRFVDMPDDVLHAALNPERSRDEAGVDATRPICTGKKRDRPLETLFGAGGRPVVLERDDELQAEGLVGRLSRPRECGSHVVVLVDDEVMALLSLDIRCEVRRACDLQVVLGVEAPDLRVLRCRSQVFGRQLENRFQHPVARASSLFAPPDQALVEQRLERVRVGAANRLGCFVRAASGEDGQRTEESLLFGFEQIV